MEKCPIHLWSDSKDALAWLNSSPHLSQTFVLHRIAEIQRLLPSAHWHYVDRKSNPADLASRGCPCQVVNDSSMWWHGPVFLSKILHPWKRETSTYNSRSCPERKKMSHIVHRFPVEECDLMQRYSILYKLLRMTAWYIRYFRNKYFKKKGSPLFLSPYLHARLCRGCLDTNDSKGSFP